MRLSIKLSAPSAIAGVRLILVLLGLLNSPLLTAQHLVILRASDNVARRTSPSESPTKLNPETLPDLFFPLTPGTWWLYRGTVTWSDQQTEKEAHAEVTLKMTVEKVIQKTELTIAVLSGFPRDLDWATGEVAPMPWLLIETRRHDIFLNPLPPDFNFAKLDQDAATLDKLLAEDNLLFRWPLKQGMKFGDSESVRRDDARYCWVVTSQKTKKLADIKGLSARSAEVSVLRYITNPDDTEIELSPGIGILSYQYHHHGTVAETSITVVEFHPAQPSPAASGAKP
jgi:ABC-type transport system substrate-binding protein